MRWKSKRFALACTAVTGLLITKFLLPAHSDPELTGYLASARRGDLEVRVATVGNLDTVHAYRMLSGVRGDRGKIIRIVEDGTRVEKGDVLVLLDPTFFDAESSRLLGEIKSFAAMVEYSNQMLALTKSQAEKTVSNEKLELFDAKQEYERFRAYIVELTALQKKGYDIASEIVQARRKTELAHTRLEKSKADVERLRREAGFKIAQAMADVNKVRGEYETLQKSLAEIKLDHDHTVVRAPAAGFVVLNDNLMTDQKHKLRVGDTVWQGQPLLYIPDTSSMVVKTQIREVDLHQIKAGQEALIKVDAYPDTAFTGHVETIGMMALENPGSTEKNFQFTVKLNGDDPRLRPGMTARVFLTVSHVADALTVPLTGVFSESGKTFCYVHDGYAFQARPVTVGQMNDEVAEITSGLNEGERVSLVKPL